MFVPYLRQDICLSMVRQLNTATSGGAIPQDTNVAFATVATNPFKGVYGDSGYCGMGISNVAADFAGKTYGCFRGDVTPESDVYTFFQVLLAR